MRIIDGDRPTSSIDALSALHHAAFSATRGVGAPWSARTLTEFVQEKRCIWVEASDEGRVIGFLLARMVLDESELLTICRFPEYAKKRIGEQLLSRLIYRLEAAKISKLFLETAAHNEAALRLYHKAGFQTVGKRRGYYQDGLGARIDALILEKILNHCE